MSKFFKGAVSSSESTDTDESVDETGVIQQRSVVRDIGSQHVVRSQKGKKSRLLVSSSGSEIEMEGKQQLNHDFLLNRKEKTVKVKEKEVRKNKEAKAVKD
uniref:Uncharacterized protein n=1 Tax=Ditylenchus dipsaci TaxID=166011 RepID=A0A915ESY3_9BILA